MKFLTFLLCLFVTAEAFAQGEGGYTAPPMSSFSQGLLTNTNAAGWTGTLGVSGGGGTTVVNAGQGITVTGSTANVTVSAIGNGSGLTNLDPGVSRVADFSTASDPVHAAFNQWTNRAGSLYFPNTPANNFTGQILSAPFGWSGDATLSTLSIQGLNNGSSIWNWTGTNGVMLNYIANNNPAVNLANITLFDSGRHGTNFGIMQNTFNIGGKGPIMWNNVAFHDLSVGAQIFNSGGFFYGENQWNCGIGMFFGTLSDNQVIDIRSLGTTNAALVMEGKGNRINYTAANEQIGILIGKGGSDDLQVSAEAFSNCVVGIGYPPGNTVFPNQTLTTSAGHIGAVTVHDGYIQNVNATNAASDGWGASIKLWDKPDALFVRNMQITGAIGVLSRTNIADATPMTFDGVAVSGGSNALQFSDGTSIPAMNPSTHYGVNVGDNEYNLASLVYSRSATDGSISNLGAYACGKVLSTFNNINNFSSPATITYSGGNSGLSGFLVEDAASVESACIGTRGQAVIKVNSGATVLDLVYASPTVTIGDSRMTNLNNTGQNTLWVQGSIGTAVSNVAGNLTLAVNHSTVIVKANGVAAITLPSAASFASGRQYQIVNDGTTNVTLLTTSSQTIGNNSTQISNTIVPGQALQVQGDTANWKYTYSPGLITTNFISGQLYTNTYGRIIEVSAGAVLSPASVSGTVAMWLSSSGYQTNYYSEGTIVGTIVAPMTNTICLKIPPGNTWVFTNMSSGTGNSALLLAGQLLAF